MKYQLRFKTPDVAEQIADEIKALKNSDKEEHLEEYERIRDLLKTYVKYGEYVGIELDTETMTASVKNAW
jgi:hypothetical protein